VVSGRSCAGAVYVAEDVDEDVVTVSGAEFDGLVVIPRQHVGGLEELPLARRGTALAALRRARRLLCDRYPDASSQVVVMTDPPATEGHACFAVLPVRFEQRRHNSPELSTPRGVTLDFEDR
jgi:hypothetical protein